MTETTGKRFALPIREAAPEPARLIFFDAAFACGVMNGVAEIELLARLIHWDEEAGRTTAEIVPVAQLRCAPQALLILRERIDEIFQMLQPAPEGATKN